MSYKIHNETTWYPDPMPKPYKLHTGNAIRLTNPVLELFKDHLKTLTVRELATAEYWYYPAGTIAIWYICQGISYHSKIGDKFVPDVYYLDEWKEIVGPLGIQTWKIIATRYLQHDPCPDKVQ